MSSVSNLGFKIKQVREGANISIEELSSSSNIDTKELEQIETGEIHPSLAIIMKLSRNLGVRLGTFFDGEESSLAISSSREQENADDKIFGHNNSDKNHLNFLSLAVSKADRNMEPFIINVEYIKNTDKEQSSHEGEEFLYVLEGEVIFTYGSETHSLKQGDSIYFDSVIHHYLTTKSESETAKVLAVTYMPQ